MQIYSAFFRADKNVAVSLHAGDLAWFERILSRRLRSNASSYWRRSAGCSAWWSVEWTAWPAFIMTSRWLYPLTPMTSTSSHPCLLDDVETCFGYRLDVACFISGEHVPRRTWLKRIVSASCISRLQQHQQQYPTRSVTIETVAYARLFVTAFALLMLAQQASFASVTLTIGLRVQVRRVTQSTWNSKKNVSKYLRQIKRKTDAYELLVKIHKCVMYAC